MSTRAKWACVQHETAAGAGCTPVIPGAQPRRRPGRRLHAGRSRGRVTRWRSSRVAEPAGGRDRGVAVGEGLRSAAGGHQGLGRFHRAAASPSAYPKEPASRAWPLRRPRRKRWLRWLSSKRCGGIPLARRAGLFPRAVRPGSSAGRGTAGCRHPRGGPSCLLGPLVSGRTCGTPLEVTMSEQERLPPRRRCARSPGAPPRRRCCSGGGGSTYPTNTSAPGSASPTAPSARVYRETVMDRPPPRARGPGRRVPAARRPRSRTCGCSGRRAC